jgi:hypothetical protein
VAKADIEGAAVAQKLNEAYAAQIQLSDDQLKKDLSTSYKFKRISFRLSKDFKPLNISEIVEAKRQKLTEAQKVLNEIKGGLSFEAAMEKYSDDPAPASGKKKGDSTVDLQLSVLTFDPDYAPLATLKAGDLSPVIYHSIQQEVLIFKLIAIEQKPQPNFEKDKANLMKNRLTQLANAKLIEDAKKLTQEDAIKWQSDGFKVLYHWYKAFTDNDNLKDSSKRLAELEKIAGEAKKAVDNPDSLGERPAGLAFFASIDPVYRAADEAKKAKLAADWADAAARVLENTESTDLRLELAKVYLSQKKLNEAKGQLISAASGLVGTSEDAFKHYNEIQVLRAKFIAAGIKKEDLSGIDDSQLQWSTDAVESLKGEAEGNTDYSDQTGKPKYSEINKGLEKLKAMNLIKPADVKAIEEFQAKWRTEKVKYDDELAKEEKKRRDEAQKAIEEQKKKAAEDKKKGSATTKPNSASPSSSSITKPPSLGDAGKKGG